MSGWSDHLRIQAALAPSDKTPLDNNIYCLRLNGEVYAVLSPSKWKRLREQGKLDSYLDKQRANGVVITRDQGG